MNENQRKQIEEARRESEEKSYCIDASGRKSMGYKLDERYMRGQDHDERNG